MATRTLDQIIAQLNPTFDPQVQSIEKRAQAIPGQIATQEQALDEKKNQAFDSILGGARQRGLGFSGIPLGEQAKYIATDYLPAQANLRTAGQERAMSLQDAILGIRERQNTLAQQIFQTEQDRAAQERQAALNRQAQLNNQANPTIGSIAEWLKQNGYNAPQQAPQITPEEQAVFSRAKSLQNLFYNNMSAFNNAVTDLAARGRAGDNNAKQAVLAAYKLIGKSDAPALKKLGLV